MSHQPFEAWLLMRDELTPDESGRLRAHLDECGPCAALAGALEEVEAEFRTAESLRPAPGFTARWRARMEGASERRAVRQAWSALGLMAGMAVSLLALLVAGVLGSPADWAAGGLRTLAGWIADARLVWGLAGAFVGSLPEPISIASGMALALGLMAATVGLAGAWFITMHRFALPVHRGGVR